MDYTTLILLFCTWLQPEPVLAQEINDLTDTELTIQPFSVDDSELLPKDEEVLPTEATIRETSCSETDASWLAWSEWTTCSDECGSCGVHMRTRTCLTTTTACTCPGSSTTIEYCNLDICRYPRSTCCYNLKVTSYNGRFACLENSTFSGFFLG